jgi:putative flippase GtrA
MRYGDHHPPMSVSSVVSRYRAHIVKLVRYASVSVVSTATSLTVLGLLVGVFNAPAGWSNAIATSIATIPSFELNRRWVWSNNNKRMVFRQVVPFAALSFAGLILSTVNVHLVGLWTTRWGLPRIERTAALAITNVGTFGVLWIFQYVLCDKVLFRQRGDAVVAVSGTGTSVEPGEPMEPGEAEPALEPALETASE